MSLKSLNELVVPLVLEFGPWVQSLEVWSAGLLYGLVSGSLHLVLWLHRRGPRFGPYILSHGSLKWNGWSWWLELMVSDYFEA